MKTETSSCGTLCQHPECWKTNLQRVKDAVRLRNGIHSQESSGNKEFETLSESRSQDEDGKQV